MNAPRPCFSCGSSVFYFILLLLWTAGYIRIGLWYFDTGGDIGIAVFNFIAVLGILLLIDILALWIRPLVHLIVTKRFDEAYRDDDFAETLPGHVVRTVRERHWFHTMIEYTVLLQRLEIVVHGQEPIETGSSVELRVLQWHPKSGVYLDQWNRDLRRSKCYSYFWLLLGTPFVVYYIAVLCNVTNLSGFPWGMLVWHFFYVMPPAIIYGRKWSRHVTKSIVERATAKEDDEVSGQSRHGNDMG